MLNVQQLLEKLRKKWALRVLFSYMTMSSLSVRTYYIMYRFEGVQRRSNLPKSTRYLFFMAGWATSSCKVFLNELIKVNPSAANWSHTLSMMRYLPLASSFVGSVLYIETQRLCGTQNTWREARDPFWFCRETRRCWAIRHHHNRATRPDSDRQPALLCACAAGKDVRR